VQGRSESRWRGIAHRRDGREARLARGGIRELGAFLGHEMRGPAGTERGGVSMAGGREGQGARKGEWGETIETNWSRDGLRLKSDNLRRCCRLQDRGAVQGRSESRWRGITHRRGGREAQLARGGIREHDAFLGHEMRAPAGTERGGVSMAGGREGQGARKGNGVWGHRLPSPPCFVQNLLKYFSFLSR